MATIRAYTTIEQSRKLAEILPLESADMYWFEGKPHIGYSKTSQDYYNKTGYSYIACWSLSALLGVLPSATLDSSNDHYYRIHCVKRCTEWYDNPVDACVAMIEKLHELKML